MSDFKINGVTQDYSSIEAMIGPSGYEPRITEISYKSSLKRKKVFGTPRKAIGRTGGQLEEESSITFLKAGFDDIIAKLGNGFGLVEFDIVITYRRRGSGIYIRDTLEGCTIEEPDLSPSAGDDPLTVKCGLSVMRILWNGKSMVDDEIG